jgi:uncharacterized membrane protein YgdD (TMEM256/DUF423 family)
MGKYMRNPVIEKQAIKKSGPCNLFVGNLLALPVSLSTAIFVGWLLPVGGVLWAAQWCERFGS